DGRVGEPVGQVQVVREVGRQGAALGAGGGDDQLGALVEAGARVVERVDRRARLEVQVGLPIDALQQVAEEGRDVVDVEFRVVLPGDDEQVLGQRQLPLAQEGVGAGEEFLRPPPLRVRDVALAADGQKEGVDAGGVNGVDGVDAGYHGRDHGAG